MTGPDGAALTRRVRAGAALCTWLGVCAVSACGPAPAPPRAPAAAPAPESPFRFDPIGADGAPPAHATVAAPLLPPAEFDTATAGGTGDLSEPWDPPEPGDGATTASAWPDVDALLDGLDVARDAKDGVVTFSGADAGTAGRVLAAAHAALSRTVRVEVAAVRLPPGTPVPSAADVLAARGDAVVLRMDRELHDGAVCIDDERATQVFPADVDLSDDTLVARAVATDLGAFLAVSPARLDARRHVLRIAFHESAAVSERRIAGDDVERDAPVVTVSALLLSAPAASGRADVAVATASDGCDGFAVAWRVTTRDDPAPPAGTRALSAHADRPPFACETPPRVGIVPLVRAAEDAADLPDAAPPALPAAALDGLRVVAAEPGIVVATAAGAQGDAADAALARFDAAVAARIAERFPAARYRRGGTSIPLVRTGDAVILQGRLDPVAVTPETEVATSNLTAATRTSWAFTGRCLRITAESGGARIDDSSAPPAVVVASRPASPRTAWATDAETHDVLDAVTVRAAGGVRHLVAGGPSAQSADGDALEILPW